MFRPSTCPGNRNRYISGYTLNQRRLAERGLLEARDTLDLLARTLRNQALVEDTGRAVLALVTRYADTWRLLLEYDEDRLEAPEGTRPPPSTTGRRSRRLQTSGRH